MKIGVLALQGAFAEHEKVLEQLGAECIELRQARDLAEPYDALVLPGGESTVQGKLLKELGMFDIMKSQIENGMPVLATCAGAILLAETIDGQIKDSRNSISHDSDVHQAECLRPPVRQLPHRSTGCGHRNSADDVYPCAVYCICGGWRGSARGCGRADRRCKIQKPDDLLLPPGTRPDVRIHKAFWR